MPGDLVVDTNRHYWVRKREAKASSYAAQRYSEGLQHKFGVMLQAICATEMETFASVFVPKDDFDAQLHLMGHGLKLSCPVERYPASQSQESAQMESALVAKWPAQQGVASVNSHPCRPQASSL